MFENPAARSHETNPETWYVVLDAKFSKNQKITHSLAKLIGDLPISFALPKRRDTQRLIN